MVSLRITNETEEPPEHTKMLVRNEGESREVYSLDGLRVGDVAPRALMDCLIVRSNPLPGGGMEIAFVEPAQDGTMRRVYSRDGAIGIRDGNRLHYDRATAKVVAFEKGTPQHQVISAAFAKAGVKSRI